MMLLVLLLWLLDRQLQNFLRLLSVSWAIIDSSCESCKSRLSFRFFSRHFGRSKLSQLWTFILGVFIAKSDVGTGTIVGSAVFNILVIIGLCGLFCTAAIQLSWWPLARDSSCYLISIFVLIGVLYDGNVYWYEAAAMVSLYFCYILIMK